MSELAQTKCTACRGDEPTLTDAEIEELRPQVPDWQVVEREGVKRLERAFRFDDFARALAFTNRVGEQAEEQGHQPTLLTEWDRITGTWWTHKIGGLHRNDFVMAARTDETFGGWPSYAGFFRGKIDHRREGEAVSRSVAPDGRCPAVEGHG